MPTDRTTSDKPAFSRKSSPQKEGTLLFIDTNIWLSFYRMETEAGLSLLRRVESISDQIIVCPQVEMEFKKNRQTVIKETIGKLQVTSISRPGIFSESKAAKAVKRNIDRVKALLGQMNTRLERILEDPAANDPVFKIFQRVYHKEDAISLDREDPVRRHIRSKALKRFLQGYPPRKNSDNSIGDAMNWEWIIHCAQKKKSDVVLVSADGDYGMTYKNKTYLNDHLKQEFNERVSSKRQLFLYTKLSEALKQFQIDATKPEKDEENRILASVRDNKVEELNSPPNDGLKKIMAYIQATRKIPAGILDPEEEMDEGCY